MFGFFFVCVIVVAGTIIESVCVHKEKTRLQNEVWKQFERIRLLNTVNGQLKETNEGLELKINHLVEELKDQDAKVLEIYEECEESKKQIIEHYENED